jgi:hypothetical protein
MKVGSVERIFPTVHGREKKSTFFKGFFKSSLPCSQGASLHIIVTNRSRKSEKNIFETITLFCFTVERRFAVIRSRE